MLSSTRCVLLPRICRSQRELAVVMIRGLCSTLGYDSSAALLEEGHINPFHGFRFSASEAFFGCCFRYKSACRWDGRPVRWLGRPIESCSESVLVGLCRVHPPRPKSGIEERKREGLSINVLRGELSINDHHGVCSPSQSQINTPIYIYTHTHTSAPKCQHQH